MFLQILFGLIFIGLGLCVSLDITLISSRVREGRVTGQIIFAVICSPITFFETIIRGLGEILMFFSRGRINILRWETPWFLSLYNFFDNE